MAEVVAPSMGKCHLAKNVVRSWLAALDASMIQRCALSLSLLNVPVMF